MKIKHLKRYFSGIVVTGLLVILTGNAFAVPVASRFMKDGDVANSFANNSIVTSPYWQVDSGSYTFIAVSHSSLSGMASQIGVKINAITSTGAAYDTAESFTITAGETQRVFIVPSTHTTVNATNITSGVFLAGTSDFTYGHVRATPVATHPQLRYGGALAQFNRNNGEGQRDSTTLTYWGSVIIEANTTGFAMEFIGDMNDSTSPALSYTKNMPNGPDMIMGTGLNLQ
jgi:hypothetical protein